MSQKERREAPLDPLLVFNRQAQVKRKLRPENKILDYVECLRPLDAFSDASAAAASLLQGVQSRFAAVELTLPEAQRNSGTEVWPKPLDPPTLVEALMQKLGLEGVPIEPAAPSLSIIAVAPTPGS